MKLLCDEGIEQQIVARLREDGHEVVYVAELSPGIADEKVLGLAESYGSLLLTSDKDFGELVYRRRLTHHGVVLLRLSGLVVHEKVHTASRALRDHGREMACAFSVVEPQKVRIRHPR